MSVKCASIGTVQQSFPASHGTGFYPLLQGQIQEQISGNHAVGDRKQDEKPLRLSAMREPLLKCRG
jgi:hypothetical protein